MIDKIIESSFSPCSILYREVRLPQGYLPVSIAILLPYVDSSESDILKRRKPTNHFCGSLFLTFKITLYSHLSLGRASYAKQSRTRLDP